jgi:6-pyruvoyltetrahydropterin/6-carboxytetrahydropterin synthase
MADSRTQPVPRRLVRVEGQRLKFAAAHMATFADTIEPLHGHNYRVTIEVRGQLDAPGWIVDFGVLKRIGREICDALDHHFLLQRQSSALGMQRAGGYWEIWFGEKRYRFPSDDVFELPVRNTTAELIAEWFWGEVRSALLAARVTTIDQVAIGVEEAPGQAGWYDAAT